MTTSLAEAPAPARPRRARGRRSLGAGSALGLGIATIWLSLLVLIPLAAVLVSAAELGAGGFWDVVTQPQTLAALRLTVTQSVVVTAPQRGHGHAAGLGAGA